MLIDRYLIPKVHERLNKGDVVILYGARQTGKTTLAQSLLSGTEGGLYLNCDEPDIVVPFVFHYTTQRNWT